MVFNDPDRLNDVGRVAMLHAGGTLDGVVDDARPEAGIYSAGLGFYIAGTVLYGVMDVFRLAPANNRRTLCERPESVVYSFTRHILGLVRRGEPGRPEYLVMDFDARRKALCYPL